MSRSPFLFAMVAASVGLLVGQASAQSYGNTRPVSPAVGQPAPLATQPAAYPQYSPGVQPVDMRQYPQQYPRPVRIWLFTGFF